MLVILASSNKNENQPATVINTDANGNTSINNVLLGQQINTLPKESLSQDETESILMMREEEKMARDVYQSLNEKWDQMPF
jgi:hypothetical protein